MRHVKTIGLLSFILRVICGNDFEFYKKANCDISLSDFKVLA